MPGLDPGIHPTAGAEASGEMDPGHKARDDIEIACFLHDTLDLSAWTEHCMIDQVFTNGTAMFDLRSIHAGTGRFFERRNSGLNSFD
jgi:hypothetical protein